MIKPYLIDSNALIDSQRDYYHRQNFQPVWDCIAKNAEVIPQVYNELAIPGSALGSWVKETFHGSTLDISSPQVFEKYAEIQQWIARCGYWTNVGFTQWASPEKADPWLIAVAKINDLIIVSHERSRPMMDANRPSKKEPKITTVAEQFGVKVIPIYEMLYDLNFQVS